MEIFLVMGRMRLATRLYRSEIDSRVSLMVPFRSLGKGVNYGPPVCDTRCPGQAFQ